VAVLLVHVAQGGLEEEQVQEGLDQIGERESEACVARAA